MILTIKPLLLETSANFYATSIKPSPMKIKSNKTKQSTSNIFVIKDQQ